MIQIRKVNGEYALIQETIIKKMKTYDQAVIERYKLQKEDKDLQNNATEYIKEGELDLLEVFKAIIIIPIDITKWIIKQIRKKKT